MEGKTSFKLKKCWDHTNHRVQICVGIVPTSISEVGTNTVLKLKTNNSTGTRYAGTWVVLTRLNPTFIWIEHVVFSAIVF